MSAAGGAWRLPAGRQVEQPITPGRVPGWLLAALMAAMLVSASAGVQPWLHAVAGAFRPPDFLQDLAAARLLRDGLLPYSDAFRAAHAQAYGTDTAHGYPYLPHPPLAVALALPLAGLPSGQAAAIWFALSVALLFVLAVLLSERWTGRRLTRGRAGPPISSTCAMFCLLVLWQPVLYHLEKGQFSLILAVLVVLAGRLMAERRWTASGACIGAAAAVKVFPVLLGALLLVRARRALLPAALTGALLTGGPLLAMGGMTSAGAWLHHSRQNLQYWQTWPSVTYGVHGVLARALVGGPWAVPFVYAPVAAGIGYVAVAVVLVGAALMSARPSSAADTGASIGTWSILLVLLNPLAMPHNAVLLAWPLADTAARLTRGTSSWRPAGWALSLVLLSIPRHTLSGLVSLPASPAAGLLVTSLPCWGTLLLFVVSCSAARLPDSGREKTMC